MLTHVPIQAATHTQLGSQPAMLDLTVAVNPPEISFSTCDSSLLELLSMVEFLHLGYLNS